MAVWMNTQKQRRVQFPKRFTFTFTRVLGRLNRALALAEFLVVFSSSLCPSTFYLLLYLFYNSIRVLLCFSILYSLPFVCFSSASANYRIQLIYLLAILDPSFTRGARAAGAQSQYRLDGSSIVWWIVWSGARAQRFRLRLQLRGFGPGYLAIGIECVHLSRHHHYEHLSNGFRISLTSCFISALCYTVLSRLVAHFNLFVINDLFKFPSLLS